MNGAKEFKCPEDNCGRILPDEVELMKHMKKRHGKDTDADDSTVIGKGPKDTGDTSKLRETVTSLASELKGGSLNDNEIYLRSVIEVEIYNQKISNEHKVSLNEIEESKKKLTEEYIIQKSLESNENEGVMNLELIEVLRIGSQKISFFDHSEYLDISRLLMLRELDLSHNRLTSLAGMKHLEKLEYLDVTDNHLDKLMGIEECPGLVTLLAGNNIFESIFELSELINLQTLDVSNNRIKNLDQVIILIQGLPKLKSLNLKGHAVIGYNI